MMRFALIIPVYNFKTGISKTYSRIAEWRHANALDCHVFFIDDGSTDGTLDELHKLGDLEKSWYTVLSHPTNRGKGAAVRTGFEAAKQAYDYVILTDCDLHYGLDIILDRLLPELVNNDVVILDRSWTKAAHELFLRRLSSGIFNRVVSLLTGVTFKDTQAGLKAFKARSCAPLFSLLRLNGFALDVEILSLASFYRLRIAQLPISFDDPDTVPRHSTVNLLKAPWVMIYELLKIYRNWKRGVYESSALRQRVTSNVYRIQPKETLRSTALPEEVPQSTSFLSPKV